MKRHAPTGSKRVRSLRSRHTCALAPPERLECRTLLAADLLVSLYDPTDGMSLLRFDDTYTPVAGSVAAGQAEGVAVAPDGSFYVSSLTTGSVGHYDSYGNYLGLLGENDSTQVTFYAPGAMQFGPNGHLYVADLGAGNIYQFDTTSNSQQFLPADTLVTGLPAVGGFTFDASGDIIVGNLQFQSVTRYDSSGTPTTLIEGGSGIVPSAILVRPNGDLLIADFDFGGQPLLHHQIVQYDIGTGMTTQFINLTFPVGTGDAEGNPPQPLSMIYDGDGDLLIGVSPDHNQNGAVLKYDAATGDYIDTLVTGIGTPSGLALAPPNGTSVVGRHIFYNQSKYDGGSADADEQDDNAIATDKSAYRADTGLATGENVTSFSYGINGIMVDIANPAGTIDEDDFIFKVGTGNSPDSWVPVAANATVTIRPGAGDGDSERVEITWPAFSITNTWLQVTVKGDDAAGGFNTNTGLDASDVFYFGNLIGDTFFSPPPAAFTTNVADEIGVRMHYDLDLPLTNVYDFDKNGNVNVADEILVRMNYTYLYRLNLVTNPAPMAVAAAAPADATAAVVSALARPAVVQPAPRGTGPIAWAPFAPPKAAAEVRPAAVIQLVSHLGNSIKHDASAVGDADVDDDLLNALLSGLKLK